MRSSQKEAKWKKTKSRRPPNSSPPDGSWNIWCKTQWETMAAEPSRLCPAGKNALLYRNRIFKGRRISKNRLAGRDHAPGSGVRIGAYLSLWIRIVVSDL